MKLNSLKHLDVFLRLISNYKFEDSKDYLEKNKKHIKKEITLANEIKMPIVFKLCNYIYDDNYLYLINELLDIGADPNIDNYNGIDSGYVLIVDKKNEILENLIHKGYNPFKILNYGGKEKTLLNIVVEKNNFKCFEMILGKVKSLNDFQILTNYLTEEDKKKIFDNQEMSRLINYYKLLFKIDINEKTLMIKKI